MFTLAALFQRAISLSGAVLCGLSLTERTVQDGKDLITATGCMMANTDEMIKCLKERTVDELLDAANRIVSSLGTSSFAYHLFDYHFRIGSTVMIDPLMTFCSYFALRRQFSSS